MAENSIKEGDLVLWNPNAEIWIPGIKKEEGPGPFKVIGIDFKVKERLLFPLATLQNASGHKFQCSVYWFQPSP